MLNRIANKKAWILPICVAALVLILLIPVQLLVQPKMLLFERLFRGGGWLEIFVIVAYGALVVYKMQFPENVAVWRIRSWTVFTIFFFSQLLLGLLVSDTFLLTGKLHLPIPMMMIAGPLYREQLSIMTLLFLSTIILSGPAWCSHLCYFGALDGVASRGKKKVGALPHKTAIKSTLLAGIIGVTLLLKFLGTSNLIATLIAIAFAVTGFLIMLFLSRTKKQMVHCIYYCPIGTVVNYTKWMNPFRMYIDSNCTSCMKCTSVCKYNALLVDDIKNRKPGITCTLCGDCVQSCHAQSIKYKLFSFSPQMSRNVYLVITITLHAVFMAMGRI